MAKTSAVEKNKRRRKLVANHAAKRAVLKAIIMNQSLPIESGSRPPSSWLNCPAMGPRPASAIVAKSPVVRVPIIEAAHVAYCTSRTGQSRQGAGRGQVELVRRRVHGNTDPLGDMLTRIRNGAARRKSSVSTPASKLRARVLDVLQAEGYIRGYSEVEFGNGKAELNIELKYYEGASVIREIARVSKPGRRVYVSVKSIPQVANGLGITILSTPKGVMADHQAREQNVGGEVLCSIF